MTSEEPIRQPIDGPMSALDYKYTRDRIASITNAAVRGIAIISYLTAGRASELCGITIRNNKHPNLEAVGPKLKDVTVASYNGIQALLVPLITLKRRKRPVRIIALPMDPRYEPWTAFIWKYVESRKASEGPDAYLMPWNRHELWQFLDEAGFQAILHSDNEPANSVHNPLRHLRLTHLRNYYGFDAFQLTFYAGWTLQASGMGGGGPMGKYLMQGWQDYFSKLLKPLPGSSAPGVASLSATETTSIVPVK